MPLIKPISDDVLHRRYRLSKKLVDEVNLYCTWAGLKNDNQFIEEAASYVLQKDKEWQKIRSEYNKDNLQNLD